MAGKAISRVNVNIGAETKQLRSELARANNSLKKFQRNVQGFASTFGVAFGGAIIAQGIRRGIQKIAEFEAEMDKVRAVTQSTDEEFQALTKDALKLGSATRFTAQQVATLQVQFGKLGFSSQEIVNSTEATLDLAVATGEDLSTAAAVAGTTLRAFQLEATEMGRVTDVMAKSFTSSALDLGKFTDSMKFAAPVARAAGVRIEFVAAMLSTLADAGVSGSIAGTSMRRILNQMALTGKDTAEAFADVSSKGITLAGAMDEVGRFAQTSLAILSSNTDKVNELAVSYDNAAGSAEAMAAVIEDNLTGDIIELTSAFDGLIQKGRIANPILRFIVQFGTKGLGSNIPFFEQMKDKALSSSIRENAESLKFFNEQLKRQQKTLSASDSIFGTGAQEDAIEKTREVINIFREANDVKREAFTGPAAKTQDVLGFVSAAIKASNEERIKQIAIDKVAADARKKDQEKWQENQNKIIAIIEEQERLQALSDQGRIDAQTEFTEGLDELEEKYIQAGEDIIDINKRIKESLEDLVVPEEEFIEESKQTFEEFKLEADKLGKSAIDVGAEVTTAMESMATGVAFAVGDMATAFIKGQDAGKILARGLLDTIGNIAIQFGTLAISVGVASKAMKDAFKLLNPVVAIAAGIGLVAAGVAVKGFGANIGSKVPALAEGGIVTKPTLALIGEAGPELVTPLPRTGFGGTGNITFNISGVIGDQRELGDKITRVLRDHNYRNN